MESIDIPDFRLTLMIMSEKILIFAVRLEYRFVRIKINVRFKIRVENIGNNKYSCIIPVIVPFTDFTKSRGVPAQLHFRHVLYLMNYKYETLIFPKGRCYPPFITFVSHCTPDGNTNSTNCK